MRWLFLVGLLLTGCRANSHAAALAQGPPRPAVLLVSLDGFRWDYLDRGLTPNLGRIARAGVRARALRPSFPTKTFPNHYSIVTGLAPGHHGIVGNEFRAPDLGRRLSMHDEESVKDARFWLGTPIWVAAERQGIRTAPFFWPGSETEIGGVRPAWSVAYDEAMPDPARVRQVLGWLALPASRRPGFVTLYFSLVDAAGHEYGPEAAETDSAIARADRLIGLLDAGLARLRTPIDLLVVSDHGMTDASPDRVIWLDDLVRRDWLETGEVSPVLMAWPRAGKEDSVVTGLRRNGHLRVYRRSELPARWQLAGSPRVGSVVAVADEGWSMRWCPVVEHKPWRLRGEHGYDDSLPSMSGIFLARGPAFRKGAQVPPFRNVHLYPLIARLLGVSVPPSDGSIDSVRMVLSAPAPSASPPPPASAPAASPPGRSSASPARR